MGKKYIYYINVELCALFYYNGLLGEGITGRRLTGYLTNVNSNIFIIQILQNYMTEHYSNTCALIMFLCTIGNAFVRIKEFRAVASSHFTNQPVF